MADGDLPDGAIWSYPVILACVGEGRIPDRPAFRRLAGRIWGEYLESQVAKGRSGRFAALRTLRALTRAALLGQPAGINAAPRPRRQASPTGSASRQSPSAPDLPR